MNIEFIKWMVGYADGWECREVSFGFDISVNGTILAVLQNRTWRIQNAV